MSESNRVSLYLYEETTFNETPAAPTMDTLRVTGESLKHKKLTAESEEINDNRQITDQLEVGVGAEGGINFELSYATFDKLLAGALCKAPVSATITASTISAAAADNSINDSGNGFVAAGFVAGMFARIYGFTGTPANNGIAEILTVTAGKITLANAAAGGVTLVDDAVGESVTVKGKMFRDGTTKKSFLLERKYADVSEFVSYRGMRVSSLTLDIVARQKITGAFSVLGAKGLAAAATVSGGLNAKNTNPIFVAGANVGSIREGGASLTTAIKEVHLQVENNLRENDKIDSKEVDDIALGTSRITLKLVLYFRSRTMYEKFQNHTQSSFTVRLTDSANNVIILTIRKLKYGDSDISAGGANQEVMCPLDALALADATTGCQLQVDMLPVS